MKTVQFWSEGTRMTGDLHYPPAGTPDPKHPAIVICHGWGQHRGLPYFQRHAEAFAAAGYVAFPFDYRGWGDSDGRVVVIDPLPKERSEVTVRVRAIREVVDPFDWAWDLRHAIDFLRGEPGVDAERIGLWGTSFAGGLVTWTAAHDPRVKCVVSQVGVQDARLMAGAEEAYRLATAEARGEADPVPQGVGDAPRLRGTPHRSKFPYWAPVEHAERIAVPLLLIDTEHEELFDRHRNSELMYTRVKAAGRAPVEYHVVQGARHGQIYTERWQEASDLALGWFDRHLKGG